MSYDDDVNQRPLASRMRTVRAVTELRSALAPERRAGRTIGLVPTMGALHEGHLSLIERARAQCDVVVVSLFVNPSQFDERADLERYPAPGGERPRTGRARRRGLAVRAVRRGGISGRVRDLRGGPGRDRPLGGRGSRGRALPGGEHGRDQAAVHGRTRRRLLRPEGRSTGARHPPAGGRPRTCPCASRPARRCARPTDWRCPAAMRCSAATSASVRCR